MWRIFVLIAGLAAIPSGCQSGHNADPVSSEVRVTVANWTRMQKASQALTAADHSFNKEMQGCGIYTADCVIEAGGRLRIAVQSFASAERRASSDVGLGAPCDDVLRRAAAAGDLVATEYAAAVYAASYARINFATVHAHLTAAHRREARWYALITTANGVCPTR